MIVRDQYGTEVFSKAYIPSPNILAPGQSTTFVLMKLPKKCKDLNYYNCSKFTSISHSITLLGSFSYKDITQNDKPNYK